MAQLLADSKGAQAPLAKAHMTNGELLLQWLTHVREGSWATFRRALSAVEPADEESAAAARRLRTRLSEMAHVEFFIDGGNRWRTFAPLLGGLCEPSGAVLSGGRTPILVDALARSSENAGCQIEILETSDGPDAVRVSGRPEAIHRSARDAGLRYVPGLANVLSGTLEPIPTALRSAVPGAAPTNWSVRSFDLRSLRWVEGLLPDTAYEYRSRHGGIRHYVRGPRHALLLLDRRTAVYAAAYLNRVALPSYDERERCLTVPMGAPLPEAMARVAAACSGTSAIARNNHLFYGGVPSAVAGVLMLVAGLRPPEPHWLQEERSKG
jgi:hypothetical protein